DLDDQRELLREVLSLSQRVGARLREDGFRTRTVTLKIRLRRLSSPPARGRGRCSPPSPVPADGFGSSAWPRPAWCRRGRSSSRCCAANGGAMSNAPWIGSIDGSGRARPCLRPCSNAAANADRPALARQASLEGPS